MGGMDEMKKCLLFIITSLTIISLLGCSNGETEEGIISVEEAKALVFEQLSAEEQENLEIEFTKKIFNAYLFKLYTIKGFEKKEYAKAQVEFNTKEVEIFTIACCGKPPSKTITSEADAKEVLLEELLAQEEAEYRITLNYKTNCCYFFDIVKLADGKEEKLPQQKICGPCNAVSEEEAKQIIYEKLTPEQQEEYTIDLSRGDGTKYLIKVYKIVDGEESILRIYKLDSTTKKFELSEYNAELLVYDKLSKEDQSDCKIDLVFNTGKSYHFKVYKIVDEKEIVIGKYAVNYITEEVRKIE
jgi:hypothetical protein